MGVRQRLLETPDGRVTPELARTVSEFCAGLDVIRAAYVGVVEVTRDFDHPVEHLVGLGEGRREPLGGREAAVRGRVHVREVDDRAHPSEAPRDLHHVVE